MVAKNQLADAQRSRDGAPARSDRAASSKSPNSPGSSEMRLSHWGVTPAAGCREWGRERQGTGTTLHTRAEPSAW